MFFDETHKSQFKNGSILCFLCVILFGAFAAIKGAIDAYLSVVIFIILVNELLLCVTSFLGSDSKIAVCIAILNSFGVTLQVIMNDEDKHTHINMMLATSMIAFISVIILHLVIFQIKHEKKLSLSVKQSKLLMGGLLLLNLIIAIVLRIFPAVNGTHAWINIGGLSIQLTELYKPITLLWLTLVPCLNIKDSIKLCMNIVYVFEISLILVVLNELGTLMVLLSTIIFISFIFFKTRENVVLLCSIVGVSGIGYLVCYFSHMIAVKATNTSSEILKIIQKFNSIYDKIMLRFSIWLDYESEGAYQIRQARKAIFAGGAFGSSKDMYIPVGDSDFVFATICAKVGFIFAILLAVLFIIVLMNGMNNSRNVESGSKFEAISIAAATLMITFSFIFPAFGSLNIIPVTGVCMPFLGNGGSSSVVCFVLIALIVSGSSQRVIKKNNKPEPFVRLTTEEAINENKEHVENEK